MNADNEFFKNLVLDILIDFDQQSFCHQAGIVDALEDFIDEWKCKHQLSRRKTNKRWKLQLTIVDDSHNKMSPQMMIERLKEEDLVVCNTREEKEENHFYPKMLLSEYYSLTNSSDANREEVLVDSSQTTVEILELDDQKTVKLLEDTAAEVIDSNVEKKVISILVPIENVEQCVNSSMSSDQICSAALNDLTFQDSVETGKGQNERFNGINDKRLRNDDDDDDVVDDDSDYYVKKKKLKKDVINGKTPIKKTRTIKRKGSVRCRAKGTTVRHGEMGTTVRRREKGTTMRHREKGTSDNKDDLPVKKQSTLKRKPTDGENHDVSNLEKKLTICEICGACVKTIKIHMLQHGDKLHKCPFCSFTSRQKGSVYMHVRRLHINYRPHLCDICGKGFVKNSILKEHIRTKHETKRERSFICSECQFSTYTLSLLNMHINNLHKPHYDVYKCELCDAKMRKLASFKEHMQLCHTNKRPFPCSICDFHAKSVKRLKSHMVFHNDKTFTCETCDKMFFTRPQLRRHQVVHTRTKDFSCPFCSYKCNVRENLRKHCRSIHQQTYPPIERITSQMKLEKKNAIDCAVNQIKPVLFTDPTS